ncbi:hypothetical protein CTheo_975 [Ceratobasidium theobromae]|uniref:Uncharacterized protein n=1 Tax=Ceratobasidium theobromae TaxID=1582974 RepID=A0A5N5QV14_9AGAM|nr:hypothetical protein CTheo_975 [Ceratobasidium theobromae]
MNYCPHVNKPDKTSSDYFDIDQTAKKSKYIDYFPFIAPYVTATNNKKLLQLAYDQCRLYVRYRGALRNPDNGLWRHIHDDDGKQLIQFMDGTVATGNAWTAKGILNVAIITQKSGVGDVSSQLNDLKTWVKEILSGTFARLDSNNLVPNYLDASETFGDTAASAPQPRLSGSVQPHFGSRNSNSDLSIPKMLVSNRVISGIPTKPNVL